MSTKTAIACGGSGPPGVPVSRADCGDRWPFTIERGTRRCTRESERAARLLVTLDAGAGIQFGLNGSAIYCDRTAGWARLMLQGDAAIALFNDRQ